jgi:hypothetical protein
MSNIEETDNENFYEIMFHYLNLNNLVLDGNMFDFKMNSFWKNEKIKRISRELYHFYKNHNDSGETIRMANEVFKELSLKYLQRESKGIRDKDNNLYYVNKKIHLCNEIIILINKKSSKDYHVFKLKTDGRKSKGYSFDKIGVMNIKKLESDSLNKAIDELNNKDLKNLDPDTNLLFCVAKDKKIEIEETATSIKNSILLNKLVANDIRFDPHIIINSYNLLLYENILPFKLDESFL